MGLVLSASFSIFCVGFFSLLLYFLIAVWLKPARTRGKLRRQGIRGPPPSLFYGNIPEMKKIRAAVDKRNFPATGRYEEQSYMETLFPYFEKWREEYGPVFQYSTGKETLLYVSDPEMVKEIAFCRSEALGKPTYLQQERRALFGHGILASNGPAWAHQRKVIAPEFFMDKAKGMVRLMHECALPMLKSWEERIGGEGGVGDVRVDEDLKNYSADVISRACFGGFPFHGKELHSRLKAIQREMAKSGILIGIPGLRYLPTKKNRVMRMLDGEVQTLISRVIKRRLDEAVGRRDGRRDLLQVLIEAARRSAGGGGGGGRRWRSLEAGMTANRFVVDNCKCIYFAGHETTASSAAWALMLLARHPEWQARARAEVAEVCRGQLTDADMLRRMKVLNMVIYETLRLYPPSTFIPREALQDLNLGGVTIPKGTGIWVPVPTLHRDPRIWGRTSNCFDPARFRGGIAAACSLPHTYFPFGMGSRMCVGQNLAMLELKVIISLALSHFEFSLSPSYSHSPSFKMVIEPQHGINLRMKKI